MPTDAIVRLQAVLRIGKNRHDIVVRGHFASRIARAIPR
jgi:hypothetical protein